MKTKILFILPFLCLSFSSCSDPNADPHYQSGANLKVISIEMSIQYSECTLFQYSNYEIVVDSGMGNDSTHIQNVIDKYCTDKTIDLMVITHPHGDHIGGFNNGAFDKYNITNLVDFGYVYNPSGSGDAISSSSLYNTYAAKRKTYIDKGTKYYPITEAINSFNNIEIDKENNVSLMWLKNDYYFSPSESFPNSKVNSDNPNITSVSFNLSYKYFNYIMCGDIDSTYGESSIVKNHQDLFKPEWKKTIVKANHHASSSSLGSTFLSWSRPNNMFISAAMVSEVRAPNAVILGNDGQAHPNKTTISRIKNYTTNLYWNAINGDLLITCNGVNDPTFSGSGRSYDYLIKDSSNIASRSDEKDITFFNSEFYKYFTK
jgi:competence protein ComEC